MSNDEGSDDEIDYEVETILNMRKKGAKREYLVKKFFVIIKNLF